MNDDKDPQLALIPIGDRVLVRLGEVEEKTANGIILPDSAQDPPPEGFVERVGWDADEQPSHTVKPGDTVLLPKFGGTTMPWNGADYTLIQEEDLLGVIRHVKSIDQH